MTKREKLKLEDLAYNERLANYKDLIIDKPEMIKADFISGVGDFDPIFYKKISFDQVMKIRDIHLHEDSDYEVNFDPNDDNFCIVTNGYNISKKKLGSAHLKGFDLWIMQAKRKSKCNKRLYDTYNVASVMLHANSKTYVDKINKISKVLTNEL